MSFQCLFSQNLSRRLILPPRNIHTNFGFSQCIFVFVCELTARTDCWTDRETDERVRHVMRPSYENGRMAHNKPIANT